MPLSELRDMLLMDSDLDLMDWLYTFNVVYGVDSKGQAVVLFTHHEPLHSEPPPTNDEQKQKARSAEQKQMDRSAKSVLPPRRSIYISDKAAGATFAPPVPYCGFPVMNRLGC